MFKVIVGNGNHMTTEGLIRDLIVNVQGHTIQVPVYLLPISGADLILGAAWLSTLGLHLADYQSLQLRFLQKGKLITLQGEHGSIPAAAQFHHIRRLHNTNAIAEAYTMHFKPLELTSEPVLDLPQDMEPELALLLHTYQEVFQQPTGLPPPREHDHCIPLIEGLGPVKVRPYRYPHSQKSRLKSWCSKCLTMELFSLVEAPSPHQFCW